jgi:hypothetical protein
MESTMSDATIFVLVFGGIFVLRFIFATIFFLYILPEGDRCPICDAVTIRVQSKGWNRLLPWFRTSWCYECHWHGLHRRGPLSACGSAAAAWAARPARGARPAWATR